MTERVFPKIRNRQTTRNTVIQLLQGWTWFLKALFGGVNKQKPKGKRCGWISNHYVPVNTAKRFWPLIVSTWQHQKATWIRWITDIKKRWHWLVPSSLDLTYPNFCSKTENNVLSKHDVLFSIVDKNSRGIVTLWPEIWEWLNDI